MTSAECLWAAGRRVVHKERTVKNKILRRVCMTILVIAGVINLVDFAHIALTDAEEAVWRPLLLGVAFLFSGFSQWRVGKQIDAGS